MALGTGAAKLVPGAGSGRSVGAVMRTVVYALVPGIAVYAWQFGWGVLVTLAIACVAAYAFEVLMLVLRDRPLRPFLGDGSVLVTALLLGLALPPLGPWWLPVMGCFFAVVVAKHLYGGLGYNTFNPAMAGYAVLLVSFPLPMSQWPAPLTLVPDPLSFEATLAQILGMGAAPGLDGVTGPTPLDHVRSELARGADLASARSSPVFGLWGGRGSEWVSLAFLAGGLWLIQRRVIGWQIPTALLAGLGLTAGLFHLLDPARYADPALHLLGGASILGAFFIATDPVTAATTPRGRLVYGAAIGMVTYAIRAWGGYPDGVAFAVLLIGMAVPVIDTYTQPRIFGARGRRHGRP
jgi:electron transport complex protein RnfD